jgi:hypothetical protein
LPVFGLPIRFTPQLWKNLVGPLGDVFSFECRWVSSSQLPSSKSSIQTTCMVQFSFCILLNLITVNVGFLHWF